MQLIEYHVRIVTWPIVRHNCRIYGVIISEPLPLFTMVSSLRHGLMCKDVYQEPAGQISKIYVAKSETARSSVLSMSKIAKIFGAGCFPPLLTA